MLNSWKFQVAVSVLLALSMRLSIAPAGAMDIDRQAQQNMLRSFPSEPVARGVTGDATQAAWQTLSQGNFAKALDQFNSALAANPNNESAMTGRSAAYLAMLQYNAALRDANAVLGRNPKDPRAHWNKARVWNDACRYTDAAREIRLVLAAKANYPEAHALLGDVLIQLGDRQGATTEYQEAGRLFGEQHRADLKSYMDNLIARYKPGQPATTSRGFSPPVENLAKLYSTRTGKDRALFAPTTKWENGATIKVAFNGGDDALRKLIVDTAPEWSKYANIKFDFTDPQTGKLREWEATDNDFNGDIRIAFERDGYWSKLGQQAVKNTSPGEASLNLDPTDWNKQVEWMKSCIQHEFGHAIGFMHEHQHPRSTATTEYRWNDDPGYQPTFDNKGIYMADSQGRRPGAFSYFQAFDNWDPGSTYYQIGPYEDSIELAEGPVDNLSIMKYETVPGILKTGKASPFYSEVNYVISEGDKKMAGQQYPFPQSQSSAQSSIPPAKTR